nr:9783_t:CDS:2 [Entrophospora candida]
MGEIIFTITFGPETLVGSSRKAIFAATLLIISEFSFNTTSLPFSISPTLSPSLIFFRC